MDRSRPSGNFFDNMDFFDNISPEIAGRPHPPGQVLGVDLRRVSRSYGGRTTAGGPRRVVSGDHGGGRLLLSSSSTVP